MTTANKYKMMRSGSGWGIWSSATGAKIKGFGLNRIAALEYLYMLNGWNLPKAGFR